MKTWMKVLLGATLDGIWLSSLFLGLLWQHENLLNIGLFMTWFAIFCNCVLGLSKDADDPGNGRLIRSILCDSFGIMILVWYGYLWAGALLLFSVLLYCGRIIKQRKDLEDAQWD